MGSATIARASRRFAVAALLAGAFAIGCAARAQAQYLVSGNDEKRSWDQTGQPVVLPPGKDTVSIIDIRNRVEPRVIANLPLTNTILGPPSSIAITPDNRLALIANGLDWVAAGGSWKPVPADKVFVVDLAAPPRAIAAIAVGKRPAGIAINRAGTLALIANRADDTVSLLAIKGAAVTLADTIALAEQETPKLDASAVAITPDGKRALVSLSLADRVELLAIDGATVKDTGYAMATGLRPREVQITPDGKLGLVNNQGAGRSDGQADTLAVIDLEQNPPRVIDQVVVGDGPDGLDVSPVGGYAAVLVANGTMSPRSAFFHHDQSLIVLLRIEGKKVRKVAEMEIGAVAKGVAFSPDGRFLYVGNFSAGKIAILRIQGTKLMQVGELALTGHPASLRGSTP